MSKPKKLEEQGPTLGGVLFYAVIVALFGALLGFLFLASIPQQTYKSVADLEDFLKKNPEPKLLDAYHFEGPISRGSSWEAKRELLLNGSATTVEFSSGELNAWMTAKFRNSGVSASDSDDAADVVIIPGVPNFFIDGQTGLVLNLPTNITIYGHERDCIVVAQGHFFGIQPEFGIDMLHVNNALIPLVGGLGDELLSTLLQAYSKTDEFLAVKDAWEKVESVELVGDSIRLKLR
jgi:hypothetical protein